MKVSILSLQTSFKTSVNISWFLKEESFQVYLFSHREIVML